MVSKLSRRRSPDLRLRTGVSYRLGNHFMMSNGRFCTDDLLRFSNPLFNESLVSLDSYTSYSRSRSSLEENRITLLASKLHGFLVAGLGVTPANAIPADR